MPRLSERSLGADEERRRILWILLMESATWELSGELRIVGVLTALASKIQHDHNEDSER